MHETFKMLTLDQMVQNILSDKNQSILLKKVLFVIFPLSDKAMVSHHYYILLWTVVAVVLFLQLLVIGLLYWKKQLGTTIILNTYKTKVWWFFWLTGLCWTYQMSLINVHFVSNLSTGHNKTWLLLGWCSGSLQPVSVLWHKLFMRSKMHHSVVECFCSSQDPQDLDQVACEKYCGPNLEGYSCNTCLSAGIKGLRSGSGHP